MKTIRVVRDRGKVQVDGPFTKPRIRHNGRQLTLKCDECGRICLSSAMLEKFASNRLEIMDNGVLHSTIIIVDNPRA